MSKRSAESVSQEAMSDTRRSPQVSEGVIPESDGEHMDVKTDWKKRQSQNQRQYQSGLEGTLVQGTMTNALMSRRGGGWMQVLGPMTDTRCNDGLKRMPVHMSMMNTRMARHIRENASTRDDVNHTDVMMEWRERYLRG
jgi:hypothetical protein